MTIQWAAVNAFTDEALLAAGIATLIVRQFIWRSADLRRMLRLPAILLAAAVAYLVVEFRSGLQWEPGDWIIVGDLVLSALTGTVMGYVTRFHRDQERLQYKLTAPGLVLWLVFVAIRIGSFTLASMLRADLADATGLILLTFGVNRLAAILIVRRRAQDLLTSTPQRIVKTPEPA